MKKQQFFLVFLFLPFLCMGQSAAVRFQGTDTAMERAFTWAKNMALYYQRDSSDPVGPWYESALPPRDAFCMRDVSHQSIGAEILGMSKENSNMFQLFAKNISRSKDWCSYWEINKSGKPAPNDYRSDKEFWYNLPANFDFLTACWKLYQWTGDKSYISGSVFQHFFRRSVDDYIKIWVLQPDSLLTRPAHPNAPIPYKADDAFDRCRGLPSYSEGIQNIKMGIDLIAAIYRGLLSYADILKANGEPSYKHYRESAKLYKLKIDQDWWDPNDSLYYTYYSNNNKFGKNEGETFLLWFDALKNKERKMKTIGHLLSKDWNVENMSYFPLFMYRNGYPDNAYSYILRLCDTSTKRRTYPEVSFGVMEGIVEGYMGVEPDASTNTIRTLFRPHNQNDKATLSGLPVLGTTITVIHQTPQSSTILNSGNKAFIWKAMFNGHFRKARANNKVREMVYKKDIDGKPISIVAVAVDPGKEISVSVCN